ncbi:GNAT family N-acetyltransferase [Salipiger sp.]|uniref:GNAT family N-acetyltransferase n=1 Tax=Salipiger sp. TaxID=2078585 RepID=UPI003A9874C6
MLTIEDARDAADLSAVSDLCRQYRRLLLEHDPDMRPTMAHLYPEAAYGAMLAALPGEHDILLLARLDGTAVGCAMAHPLPDGSCEAKRVFVSDAARGRGVARALMTALIARARELGYGVLRLDTATTLVAAQRLYESLGFARRGPYAPVPPIAEGRLCFFELALGARADQLPVPPVSL